LILRHYYIQNVKDGIQIGICTINKENVTHFSQLISVKVKEMLRKSQVLIREKLKKLKLRQNGGFLMKKDVISALIDHMGPSLVLFGGN